MVIEKIFESRYSFVSDLVAVRNCSRTIGFHADSEVGFLIGRLGAPNFKINPSNWLKAVSEIQAFIDLVCHVEIIPRLISDPNWVIIIDGLFFSLPMILVEFYICHSLLSHH